MAFFNIDFNQFKPSSLQPKPTGKPIISQPTLQPKIPNLQPAIQPSLTSQPSAKLVLAIILVVSEVITWAVM